MDRQDISHQKSLSPPKTLVDSSPLQTSMERNRESLKIKLMVRRSANQLVEQGILPPLKTSPAIHEQKKLLERAKTGDLLKAKIQQRPNREELERRHILESHESHIDPSLADKYRMLEKAILVDQLNSKISHRPGPLELIEKNILHANEPIERIVKEGLVPFKASTDNLFLEDDSQSSEGDFNSQIENGVLKTSTSQEQQVTLNLNQNVETIDEHPMTTPLNVINLNVPIHTSVITKNALVPKLTLHLPGSVSNDHETITLPCLVTKDLIAVTSSQKNDGVIEKIQSETIKESKLNSTDGNIKHHISSFLQNNQKFPCPSSGKEKIKKKCKIKPTSKIKAIKFHEYKGPPNSQRNNSTAILTTVLPSTSSESKKINNSNNNNNNKKLAETNYELIMQQQCLLEYLEGIYKNPNKSETDSNSQEKQISTQEKVLDKIQDEAHTEDVKKPFITIFPSKSPTSINTTSDKDSLITDTNKLGKMKVSELKSYLKKLNLPVSGPKPLLIERLKPYLPFKPSEIGKFLEKVESITNLTHESKDPLKLKILNNSMDSTDLQFKDDDIVKEQQRQIEELQRKLLQSQSELEKIRLSKVIESNDNSINSKDQFFQIMPDSNNIQKAGVLYDTKYQLPNKVSTVFVVGVTSLNPPETSNTIPMVMHEQIENAENINVHRSTNHKIDQTVVVSPQSSDQSDIKLASDKSNNFFNNTIVQDDINDVLEILLNNEKWNGENEAFRSDKNGILEETNKSFSNSINNSDIILGGSYVTNDEILTPTIDENIKNVNLIGFPMEVEENSNSNIDSSSSCFKEDLCEENLQCIVFDDYCNDIIKNNTRSNNKNDSSSTNSNNNNSNNNTFSKSADNISFNGIKNSLIGNFDNGLFDTFKTNIVHTTSNNLILSDVDHKEIKYNDKFTFNGINNFDMFGNNNAELPTTTPMDFENIISYDIYQQHDPFFNINNNFQNERDNIINSQINTSSAMLCEDDNMFEAGNNLNW